MITVQSPYLVFDPLSHLYLWEGARQSSATEILGTTGIKKNGRFVALADGEYFRNNDDARVFGTSFHAIVAGILRGQNVSFPNEIAPYIDQWGRWRERRSEYNLLRDENGEAIVEYPLFSERLGYAGTVDAVFISDSKLLIVDWKTTVVEMEYWRYQTAAYERLLQEVFPGIVRTCTAVTREAVRFHDTGFESVRRERNPEDWIVFQSALNLRKALL